MIIGIPRETRAGETRVAATPETVKKLAATGKHQLVVETGAGTTSSIPDREFQAAGPRESVLLRVAQVVRTLTSTKGVSSVRFLIDGEASGLTVRASGRKVVALQGGAGGYTWAVPMSTEEQTQAIATIRQIAQQP